TASKGAAVAIFARIFYVGLHHFQLDWSNILATIAALSMVLGNLAAITQDNVKRMLAYSSIGHAGYVLLGILSMNAMGLWGVLLEYRRGPVAEGRAIGLNSYDAGMEFVSGGMTGDHLDLRRRAVAARQAGRARVEVGRRACGDQPECRTIKTARRARRGECWK